MLIVFGPGKQTDHGNDKVDLDVAATIPTDSQADFVHALIWWNDGEMMDKWMEKMMDKWIGAAQNPMGDHQHEQTAHRVAHFQVRHECSSTWSAMAERLQPFEDPVREFQKTQQAGWRATRSWGNLKQQI